MKKIENKKTVVKNKFTQYCRAALLSLFVMLMIPSISSDIFGNGDAEAGCNPANSAVTSTADMNANLATLLCGGNPTAGEGNGCLTVNFGSIPICTNAGSGASASCTAITVAPVPQVRCVALDTQPKCVAAGNNCSWGVEDTQNNKLVDAVCRVYKIATGTAGKAFAAVGVISVGIGFFTGKVSWGLMISVAAGIAVFFGAPSIIAVISGDQSATALCNQVSQ
ncbi:TrbC/VirB2 family protein [Rickettsiales bacterium]|nr:TrbC/VirB2 family protein [Rickettsiales bacterium]